MYYYGPMMNSESWAGGILMILFWLAFLVILAYVVFRLFRATDGGASPRRDPLDIAKERYAKGELNKEQFDQLKKDLLA